MKALRLEIKLVLAVFCLTRFSASAMQANTANGQETVLIPEKPVAAPVNNKKSTEKTSSGDLSGLTKTTIAPNMVTDETQYPLIGKLETITFGKAKPTDPIEDRLNALEQEIFHANYKNLSLFDRTQKLKLTILGPNELLQEENPDFQNNSTILPLVNPPMRQIIPHELPELTYFEMVVQSPENQTTVDERDLPAYALELINKARLQLNFPPLNNDKTASLVAERHIADLHKRRVVSHINEQGENPDLRYTNLGGNGAIVESVTSLRSGQTKDRQYTRALVAQVLKQLIDRQDDRESLLSPDATGLGFALKILPEQRRAIACVEVTTNHGSLEAIPNSVRVGDKIEISGYVEKPYKFARLTLAWEGISKDFPSGADETEEALPYFPPLDYVGYKHKGEHDYSGVTTALKMGCLVGVIAGGVFIPPVALAAPLVLMTPDPTSEPKPMSDIPLHGGVKIDGNSFKGKVTMSNAGKPGIYYVTVWATLGKSPKQIPISRRAFVLTESSDTSDKHS